MKTNRNKQALYGEHGLWVRPAGMWTETITLNHQSVPRFTLIGE